MQKEKEPTKCYNAFLEKGQSADVAAFLQSQV